MSIVLEILHAHLVFLFLILLVYVEGALGQRCSPLDEGTTSSSVLSRLHLSYTSGVESCMASSVLSPSVACIP
jgi:hypothetical protein